MWVRNHGLKVLLPQHSRSHAWLTDVSFNHQWYITKELTYASRWRYGGESLG